MAQTRKLYGSRTNRKPAGVCGGLAQHFNTDATLIRALSWSSPCSAALAS
jgi:phage shock protein PspC (stress-responsive transcriptional regulator)